jgi:hypothetical protein
VNNIIGVAVSAMQQLRDLASNAYKQGQYSMIPWVVVAFTGGVLAGMMVERAVMPRIAPG